MAIEAIQSLTAQKMQELLELCEIRDRNLAPISQQILVISNFVYQSRLRIGKHEPPSCVVQSTDVYTQASGNKGCRLRRSTTRPPDYAESSTRSPKRGRNRQHSCASLGIRAPPAKKISSQCDTLPLIQENGQQVGGAALRDRMADNFSEVRVVANDETNHMVAVSRITPASRPNRLSESTARGEASQPESPAEPPRHVQTAGQPSTGLVHTVDRSSLLQPQPSFVPPGLGGAFAFKVMDTILLDCVKLNYARGKRNNEETYVKVRTEVEQIRRHAKQLAEVEYHEALRAIKMKSSAFATQDMQIRYNETVYWNIISNGAKLLDPAKLPPSKGPLDEFTKAEKVAAEIFMVEAGHGASYTSQQRYRRLWKSLSEMRETGVDKILFYRTKEFDRFCMEHAVETRPTLVEKVLFWENTYGPYIEQLESRVAREIGGDFTGRVSLHQPHIEERLEVSCISWDSSQNPWYSVAEENDFNSISGSSVVPGDQLRNLFRGSLVAREKRNKSIFVMAIPRDEKFLSLCSIITVQGGDILGCLAGKIRYSESFDRFHGIRGPTKNLWLDYSQVTGLLNLMRVLPLDGDEANVSLQWEPFEDGTNHRAGWRVLVRALKTIKPFEEVMRAASQTEQYILHQNSDCARMGFMTRSSGTAQKHFVPATIPAAVY